MFLGVHQRAMLRSHPSGSSAKRSMALFLQGQCASCRLWLHRCTNRTSKCWTVMRRTKERRIDASLLALDGVCSSLFSKLALIFRQQRQCKRPLKSSVNTATRATARTTRSSICGRTCCPSGVSLVVGRREMAHSRAGLQLCPALFAAVHRPSVPRVGQPRPPSFSSHFTFRLPPHAHTG